jgi:hypothetical protein
MVINFWFLALVMVLGLVLMGVCLYIDYSDTSLNCRDPTLLSLIRTNLLMGTLMFVSAATMLYTSQTCSIEHERWSKSYTIFAGVVGSIMFGTGLAAMQRAKQTNCTVIQKMSKIIWITGLVMLSAVIAVLVVAVRPIIKGISKRGDKSTRLTKKNLVTNDTYYNPEFVGPESYSIDERYAQNQKAEDEASLLEEYAQAEEESRDIRNRVAAANKRTKDAKSSRAGTGSRGAGTSSRTGSGLSDFAPVLPPKTMSRPVRNAGSTFARGYGG